MVGETVAAAPPVRHHHMYLARRGQLPHHTLFPSTQDENFESILTARQPPRSSGSRLRTGDFRQCRGRCRPPHTSGTTCTRRRSTRSSRRRPPPQADLPRPRRRCAHTHRTAPSSHACPWIAPTYEQSCHPRDFDTVPTLWHNPSGRGGPHRPGPPPAVTSESSPRKRTGRRCRAS